MKYVCDMPYFLELPTSFIKATEMNVFFKLKKHKRKVSKDNLEKIVGMEYIVYSPATLRYWYLYINEYTNMRKIYKYFKDGNVYVTKEARAPVDEDSVLY
jgi:hypothetical protein